MDGLARPEDSRAPELEDSLLRQVALAELPLRTPRPGERLGGKTGDRFEILEKLGTGAMGQVFQAWDEELQRIVALKFLRSHAPLAEERLLTVVREEARAIARLNHENIVHVFDVSEWKGQPWEPEVPFLIMEHLEGTSLASILAQGQLTLRRSLELMSTITAGLAHAHEHHIVHRDLKPSNVFVLRKGQVKLIDFGLAHYTVNSALHLPTAGTPAYMAPEQWRGEAQDARTDVWAAGIMLHEMLTGAFPYPMTTPAELRAWVTSTAPVPSPLQRHPELPQQVEVLLSRALAKDPTRRFPTAAEFHAALSQLMEVLGPWRPEPQPLGPQRRQVTLVCCRLEGRASPLQTFDTEESGEMEAAFQRSCSKLLREHGGMIASCIGDQVLACFGHPLAQEDDSEHAVRAGLNLVSALRQELPRPLPGTFTVKVGIHTGLVVLDDMPMEARGWTPAIQGEAPQLAEWLARHTAPDTVVLSDTTWMLVRGAFVTEACAPLSYAGRAGPRELELRRVVRERRTPLRFDRSRLGGLTPLVGREQEVQQLTSSWATAKSGRGAFVLVSGEAGIGKSRLIRELRQHASPEPHLRLQCQCWAQFQTSAFYPVVEALQRLFRMAPQDAPSQRLHMLEEQLRALDMEPEHVRLIALFLSLPIAEESPHLRLSPQLQKEKTFEALEVLFQRLTRKHPLLVVVEDLHWADPSTLELLGFLIERLAGHRLLMLLSTRPGFLSSWAPGPELQKMTLERLPTHRTAALVREATHGRALPPEMIEYLVARTDGIPLFVEEMTRMVLERPCSSASKPSSFIPSTLHELLLSQLDLLPHQQRALAQLCAVVGRSFDHSLLVAIANRTDAGLKRDLAGLLDSGLLQQQD
jgi:serine/threonine protein kinase